MRILMLVQHAGIQGPLPKHTPLLVEALRSLGCSVVTHGWGRQSEHESLRAKLRQRLADVRSARRTSRAGTFDVVVVKTAHDWRTLTRDIAVALALGRTRPPVVLQLHGSRSAILSAAGHRLFKLATRFLLSLVDGLLVLSTEEQREWRAFSPKTPVLVVKNPYVRSLRASRDSPDRGGELRLLYVGRLLEDKGVFDLVEALPGVLDVVECHLVIAGDGADGHRLREVVRTLDLEEHVTLAGYLRGAELEHAFAEATIFVLPSKWPEGFPTVLAEAMDAELAIVTTSIRGAVDHLVDGEHAVFVEPGDVPALTGALVSLLGDPERRRRMGAASGARLERFDPKAVGRDYVRALETIVGSTGRRSGGV
jgi:glycosyltransferase involved in cell wall biosynthesis